MLTSPVKVLVLSFSETCYVTLCHCIRRFEQTCRSLYQDGQQRLQRSIYQQTGILDLADGRNMIRYDIYVLQVGLQTVAVDLTLCT